MLRRCYGLPRRAKNRPEPARPTPRNSGPIRMERETGSDPRPSAWEAPDGLPHCAKNTKVQGHGSSLVRKSPVGWFDPCLILVRNVKRYGGGLIRLLTAGQVAAPRDVLDWAMRQGLGQKPPGSFAVPSASPGWLWPRSRPASARAPVVRPRGRGGAARVVRRYPMARVVNQSCGAPTTPAFCMVALTSGDVANALAVSRSLKSCTTVTSFGSSTDWNTALAMTPPLRWPSAKAS